MIRVHTIACHLSRDTCDALNHESGQIYPRTLVWHYRIYRRTGHWFTPSEGERFEDGVGGSVSLHAHSRDAAQQGFYAACKTAKAQKKARMDAHYPHKRKWYRTTTWKNTGMALDEHHATLSLKRARGFAYITVALPESLSGYDAKAYRQMELVYNHVSRQYDWHLTIDDGQEAPLAPGTNSAAIDLGEIHPVAMTDGQETVIIACRQLRSEQQYTVKRLAAIQEKQSKKVKGSRSWKQLQRRKTTFLAKQEQKVRDITHKVSHAAVQWAAAHEVGTLAIGDVRDVANGKRLNRKSQQKIGLWNHGQMRQYLTYKAQAKGITVVLVDEHHTTKTCPIATCGQQHKPKGRVYRCPTCGFVGHRDGVGAVQILSRHRHGKLSQIRPPSDVKYRYPVLRGKRSRRDTAHVA